MKKVLLWIFLIFILSSCSIDWNWEKDKKIENLTGDNILLKNENERLDEKNKDLESKIDELKTENLNLVEKQSFNNNLKCQEFLNDLKKQYENVFSVYYNEYENKCYVKYYNRSNNNILDEWPLDSFWPVDKNY